MIKGTILSEKETMMNGYARIKAGFKVRLFKRKQRKQHYGALINRVWSLTLAAGVAAIIALYFMSNDPTYLYTSLLVGITAMTIDLVIEYSGIRKRNWDYPGRHISFSKVPLEVPILFLFCGILATYISYAFSNESFGDLLSLNVIPGVVIIQILLLLISIYFMTKYFLGKIKTLIFWALPLSIAFYMSFPEPWLLAFSIIPVYIDYYLEKRLVKTSDITYAGYGDDIAINVSLSYFPVTLLIMMIVAAYLHIIGG